MRIRFALMVGLFALVASACQFTEQVSVGTSDDVVLDDISGDGRYVLFRTTTSLVAADTNGQEDFYRRDLLTNSDVLVTQRVGNTQLNTTGGAISDDGNVIAFDSKQDFVAGDGDGKADVFVYVVDTQQMSLVSKSTAGVKGNEDSTGVDISGNGDAVVFESTSTTLTGDLNPLKDVFMHVRSVPATVKVSAPQGGGIANSGSLHAAVNSDGSVVAFSSAATNLGLTPDPNGLTFDVFTRAFDASGTIELISATQGVNGANGGSFRPRISADALTVSFYSSASNLATGVSGSNNFVRLRNLGVTVPLETSTTEAWVSANGRVVLSNDNWYEPSISGPTPIHVVDGVPVDTTGRVVSADGRYIAFATRTRLAGDTDLKIDIFVVSTLAPTATSVSPSSLPIGQTRSVTISGMNFAPGTTVQPQIPGVTVNNVVFVSSTTLQAQVTVSGSLTPRTTGLNVRGPNGGPGVDSGGLAFCFNCLTLTN